MPEPKSPNIKLKSNLSVWKTLKAWLYWQGNIFHLYNYLSSKTVWCHYLCVFTSLFRSPPKFIRMISLGVHSIRLKNIRIWQIVRRKHCYTEEASCGIFSFVRVVGLNAFKNDHNFVVLYAMHCTHTLQCKYI